MLIERGERPLGLGARRLLILEELAALLGLDALAHDDQLEALAAQGFGTSLPRASAALASSGVVRSACPCSVVSPTMSCDAPSLQYNSMSHATLASSTASSRAVQCWMPRVSATMVNIMRRSIALWWLNCALSIPLTLLSSSSSARFSRIATGAGAGAGAGAGSASGSIGGRRAFGSLLVSAKPSAACCLNTDIGVPLHCTRAESPLPSGLVRRARSGLPRCAASFRSVL